MGGWELFNPSFTIDQMKTNNRASCIPKDVFLGMLYDIQNHFFDEEITICNLYIEREAVYGIIQIHHF